jgi:predicted membrane protein
MENENRKRFRAEKRDGFWTGMILLIVGAALFAEKSGAEFPGWFFHWPMLLILIGVITGIKHRFRDLSWLVFMAVGGVFLVDDIIPDWDIKPYFWPLMLIGVGLLFILRPKKRWHTGRRNWDGIGTTNIPPTTGFEPEPVPGEDMVESVSIFGSVKKVVTSKNFKGGEIICIMGGAEYNLSQADFTGPITIEIVQVFGGTKLIVPPHWEIRSEAVAIFAGSEDKRPVQPGTFDPSKILILKGVSIFGGIEIKSY